MQNSTLFRRAAALLLTAALTLTLVLPGLAAYEMPIQTVNEGESVYLFNADIDKPILEQNADQQRYIASLTKMMTTLLLLENYQDQLDSISLTAPKLHLRFNLGAKHERLHRRHPPGRDPEPAQPALRHAGCPAATRPPTSWPTTWAAAASTTSSP